MRTGKFVPVRSTANVRLWVRDLPTFLSIEQRGVALILA